MEKNMRIHILANLILEKKVNVDTIDMKDEERKEVYWQVAEKLLEQGNIFEGITIFKKAQKLGAPNYIPIVGRIAVERINHKDVKVGIEILKAFEKLGDIKIIQEHIRPKEFTDGASLLIKDNKIEEGFKLLSMLKQFGDESFVHRISEIGYEKIVNHHEKEGIVILKRLKELIGKISFASLENFVLNNLKNNNIDIAIEVLDEVKPFEKKEYAEKILDIGYKKIAMGDIRGGERIVLAMKNRGIPIDSTIVAILENQNTMEFKNE